MSFECVLENPVIYLINISWLAYTVPGMKHMVVNFILLTFIFLNTLVIFFFFTFFLVGQSSWHLQFKGESIYFGTQFSALSSGQLDWRKTCREKREWRSKAGNLVASGKERRREESKKGRMLGSGEPGGHSLDPPRNTNICVLLILWATLKTNKVDNEDQSSFSFWRFHIIFLLNF